MSERLFKQLEEMEEQLGVLKGAIEVIQDAESASTANMEALQDAQSHFKDACDEFIHELESQTNEFSEKSNSILSDVSGLVAKLDNLDAGTLANLLNDNKAELSKLSAEQIAALQDKLLSEFENSSKEEHALLKAKLGALTEQISTQDENLRKAIEKDNETLKKSITDQQSAFSSELSEKLAKNAAEERDILVEKLAEHKESFKVGQERIEDMVITESTDLKAMFEKQNDSIESELASYSEKVESNLATELVEVKKTKTFSILAASLGGAACIFSLIGLIF